MQSVAVASKPALADSFGREVRYLRISLTDRCNFRCMYCMPAEGLEFLPRASILSFEEIARIARLFAAHGVSRIRLTGGEPTLRRDLETLIAQLAAIDGIDDIAMTTNAFLLARRAASLRAAGLNRLNVSLDSLVPERFTEMTRVGSLDAVERGIESARAAGFERIKLNAVIVRGFNDDELVDITRWAFAREMVPRFIEFMPIGGQDVRWGDRACVPVSEMRAVLGSHFVLERETNVALGAGPARYWRAHGPSAPSGGALVGFISAVTECFCAGCNRVRITPEGKLRACLADDREVDLRGIMRTGGSDADLLAGILRALGAKRETHRFEDGLAGATMRNMTSIGG